MGTTTSATTTLSGLIDAKSYDVQVRATNAEGTSAWSATGQGVTNANSKTFSIPENSLGGTKVGTPVTVTSNPQGYDLTHILSGTDADKFTVVSSSGQIRVKSGADLDYETKAILDLILTVRASAPESQVQSQSSGSFPTRLATTWSW